MNGERERPGARLARRLLGFLIPFTVHFLPFTVSAQILDDTLAADTLGQDTVDYTARFLEAQGEAGVRVPVMPVPGVRGPAPALTRVVFTRDSIEWGHASTLGDLLTQMPGVYLWRGGFIGRPEPVNYQGRGGTSVEYLLDGLPYLAAGVDSIAVDPALISISFLDRIEVERLPGLLRVHLFTLRHDRRAPLSRIGIGRGDQDFARYEGALTRRAESGIGFGLAADYLSSPTASGSSSSYSNTQILAQGGYVPSARFGVQFQLLRSGPNRRPFVGDAVSGEPIGLGFDASRSDAQLRLALRSRPDGLGSSVDLIYGRTAWDGGGVDQRIHHIGGWLGHRAATASLGASAMHRTRWTPLDLRGTAGWSPSPIVTTGAELVYQRHRGGRNSNFVTLSAGLQPIRGLALTGTARLGNQVAAPAVITDTAQRLRDFRASVGWERDRLAVELGWARTSAFSPFGYAEFPGIPSLAAAPAADWITLSARIRPLRWIALEGWYSDPRGDAPDGIPPTHSVAAVTLRSKFLR
ncbi:MAG: TonB-dependent receptor plug domain-containing protein, partial [Gemmatimonadales bacterium]|nr:TonB-dependent receptor plug domain-containing protein [Gemmatimonadales bacterium]